MGWYLAERKKDAFEEGAWFIERFFDCHVEMVVQFLVLGDIVSYFI
jgi:hypothetical protein